MTEDCFRHLSNEGVEETPPSRPCRESSSGAGQSPDPAGLFVNLEGCNIGLKHFHPMPITQNGNKLSGQGDMGGCWEWTSSVLEKHQGFEPMELYPAYTGKDYLSGVVPTEPTADSSRAPPLEIRFYVLGTNNIQRISSTVSIISYSVDLGQVILASRDAGHCKLSPRCRKTRRFIVLYSINWYQRNYPYVWAGARLVRDL